MQNPCDICIIRVNCTQICWKKENNIALLRNAISNYMKGSRPHPDYIKEWQRFSGLYNQGLTDWANIKMREREAKEGMG